MWQIDSLDTLALLGDYERFSESVQWIGKNLRFEIVSKLLELSRLGALTLNDCISRAYLVNHDYEL